MPRKKKKLFLIGLSDQDFEKFERARKAIKKNRFEFVAMFVKSISLPKVMESDPDIRAAVARLSKQFKKTFEDAKKVIDVRA